MEINSIFCLKTLRPSAINLYKCILQEKSDQSSSIASRLKILTGIELIEIIETQFDELHNPGILVGVLKIFHLTIQQSTNDECQIMSKSMKNLLTKFILKEQDYLVALQLLKQFLVSLPKSFPIEKELVDEIFPPNNDNSKVQNQLALCTCLLVEKFELMYLLEVIWNEILKKKSASLLVHYIDFLVSQHHVYQDVEFWKLIETFLLSESNRKMAIFAIRKVLKFLSNNEKSVKVEKYFFWPGEAYLSYWLTYLTVLENLEEKQSHLILPALQMLESVYLGEKTPWIRIVLQQMLRHKNNLVLRWSVNYLLSNFSKLILGNEILRDFFHATNNTWLYNEKDFQLPPFGAEEQQHLMEVFAEIPWKSIPMHAWLMEMKQKGFWNDVRCETVINAATKIRQLQNRFIRTNCRDLFTSIFNAQVENMDLNDYMQFLDALYSSTDKLSPDLLSVLLFKIKECSKPFVSFNVFAILRKQELCLNDQMIVVEKLRTVKSSDHKWFSVLVTFFFENIDHKTTLCLEHYCIDLKKKMSLQTATSEFVSKLSWDDVSKAVIREITVDWYTTECGKIDEDDFEDLLYTGGIKTLLNIANPARRNFALNSTMLNCLLAELKTLSKHMMDTAELVQYMIESCKNDQPNHFYKYLNETLDIDVTNNRLAFNVFKIFLKMCTFHEVEGMKLLIRGLLFGEPLSGDARLEYEYAVRMDLNCESSYKIREACSNCLKVLDKESLRLLKSDLVNQSKQISVRKPRYFENSKHHRLKLRIAEALAFLNKELHEWDDYYLYAILQENNQLNVTYIYEFIVATTISESELINQMDNLSKLSTSCQSSMFAISYLFSVHHQCKKDFGSKLVTLLLPWTMGSNFNTRLYAQIAAYHLIKRFKIDRFDHLKTAIKKGLTESTNAIEKLNTDVRFNFPNDLHFLNIDPILYVTVVPEDERLSSSLRYLNNFDSLKESRRLHLLKKESNKEQEPETAFEDVQRKMNPEINCSDPTSINPEVVNTDMIVVASLIDKLPNLGGIARTCEVLGIKELVLDSIKHAQNKEFKNLSMTAENWINITEIKPKALKEFLDTKKIEGYEIVGAEQTSKSVNFMEFQFPKKCVLLLGHEKEGIPADLIALLDYAVEIPQFGMVRSLNVHVTGALFMYEYCKQHLTKLKM